MGEEYQLTCYHCGKPLQGDPPMEFAAWNEDRAKQAGVWVFAHSECHERSLQAIPLDSAV
jgi:hypothetical protein